MAKPQKTINASLVKQFDKEKLKAVQVDLKSKGLYKGRIDGIYGPLTEKAISLYNDRVEVQMNLPSVEVKALSKQTENQLKANKEWGDFPSKYMLINDNTNTGFIVNPDHTIDKSFPVITGKSKGDVSTAPSSRQYLEDNPDKSFEDYIKYLEETDQKVTPSGFYMIGKKDAAPSKPKGIKANIKQALFDLGLASDEYDITTKRYTNYGDRLLTLQNQEGKGISQAIHGTGNPSRIAKLKDPSSNRDVSAGCVNVGDIEVCFNDLEAGSPVQILPEELEKTIAPNMAAYTKAPKAVRNIAGKLYAQKEKLSPSDDFDKDVSTVIAIMRNESSLGQGRAYAGEKMLHSIGLLGADNSLGPGQVKWSAMSDNTKRKLFSLGITSADDLMDENKASLAVYEKLQELKENSSSDFDMLRRYMGSSAKDLETAPNNVKRYYKNVEKQMNKRYTPSYKKDTDNYNAGGVLEAIGSGLGLINPILGAVSSLGPLLGRIIGGKPNQVYSASPGNYVDGGNISRAKAREMLHDGTVHGKKITPKQRRYFGAIASGYQSGGPITPFDTLVAPASSTYVRPRPQQQLDIPSANLGAMRDVSNQLKNTTDPSMRTQLMEYVRNLATQSDVARSARGYAAGGDIPLSSSAFQVTGDPSKVDSETYNIGLRNIRLDNDEVYKQGEDSGYVYSNRLKLPNTKKSFADVAKKHEAGIGRAEKKMRANPSDIFSINTINHANKALADLAGMQELVAASKGLREPLADASTGAVPSMQAGGPVRTPRGGATYPYSYDPYDPFVDQLFGMTNAPYQNTSAPINPQNTLTPRQADITTIPTDELLGVYNNEREYGVFDKIRHDELVRRGAIKPGQRTGKLSKVPQKTQPVSPLDAQDEYALSQLREYQQMYEQNRPPLPDPFAQDTTTFGTPITLGRDLTAAPPFESDTTSYSEGDSGNINPDGSINVGGASTADNVRTPFTFGDALQTLSAASKFGLLIGGPEKEATQYNAAPITQPVYDPTNALYQNQRSFSTARSALSNTPSINTSRALSSSLYAQNLNQQNNILSQYERMNTEAKQGYEERLRSRRGENIRYALMANEANARNRGAYMNATQNAFDTLSTLGQNFNQKAQSDVALSMFRETYKDVFDRVARTLNQQGLFNSER